MPEDRADIHLRNYYSTSSIQPLLY